MKSESEIIGISSEHVGEIEITTQDPEKIVNWLEEHSPNSLAGEIDIATDTDETDNGLLFDPVNDYGSGDPWLLYFPQPTS